MTLFVSGARDPEFSLMVSQPLPHMHVTPAATSTTYLLDQVKLPSKTAYSRLLR